MKTFKWNNVIVVLRYVVYAYIDSFDNLSIGLKDEYEISITCDDEQDAFNALNKLNECLNENLSL